MVQTESELRASSKTVWKCLLAILVSFACLGGISYHSIPGLFLLIWATATQQCEISVAMSDLLNLKRKRTEDKDVADEFEKRTRKKQREAGGFDSVASVQPPHNLKEDHPRSAVNVISSRSILVDKLSEAQAALEFAQSELEKWESDHQSLDKLAADAEDDEAENNSVKDEQTLHEDEEEIDEEYGEEDEEEEEDELWSSENFLKPFASTSFQSWHPNYAMNYKSRIWKTQKHLPSSSNALFRKSRSLALSTSFS